MFTRWRTYLPRKVNIFYRRTRLNRLPTRINLDDKGIDIPSIVCGICNEDIDEISHIFISCKVAVELWRYFGKWCGVNVHGFSQIEDVIQ